MKRALEPPAAGELHAWRIALPAEGGRDRARAALATILADYLGGAEEAAIGLREDGKPRLAEAPERLSFNLSHTDGMALVAIAPGGTEVGLDVERLRSRRDPARLARRWLPAADAAAVAAADPVEREAVFYAAWTRYEARCKCTGVGLAGPPPGPEVGSWPLDVGPAYAAAVAVYGCVRPCVIWTNARQAGFARKPVPDLNSPTESQNAHDSGRSFQENQ